MNLYLVQDSDRPIYVVAGSWKSALDLWRERIRTENPEVEDWGDGPDPDGIQAVSVEINSEFPDVLISKECLGSSEE